MPTFAYELRHWSQKSCRSHLDNRDLKFIESVLGDKLTESQFSEDLTGSLINDDRVIKTILECPEQLHISPQLYFYVLLKRAFETSGIYNTSLVEYIVFLLISHITSNTNNNHSGILYISDYLNQINLASNKDVFYLRVELANKILVLTGIFQEYMKHRTSRRAAPDLSYYEVVGSTQYEAAMHHPLAKELDLKAVFGQLSTSFDNVRQILNEFSERFISLGDPFRDL